MRAAFLQLDRAVERVRESDARGPLTISVAPMFATKWLVPRLQQFHELYPDIDVRISSSLQLVNFERDAFDAAIRLGPGEFPGLTTIKLFDERVTPLCSPRLLEGEHRLTAPDDFRHHMLLHDDSLDFDPDAPNWSSWLQAAGANKVDATRGSHFSHPDHSLQAAIDGAGVVLG